MEKSDITQEEKNIYIRLFYPLRRQQKEDVYNIWKDNIGEDISIKYKELEKYCEKNDCDLMMALFQIYDSYNIFYCFFDYNIGTSNYINSMSYSESMRGINRIFLDNKYQKKITNIKDDTLMRLNKSLKNKPIGKESNVKLEAAMESYLKKLPQKEMINEYRVYFVYEERKNIEDYILELIRERRGNPEKYINDKLKTKVRINKKSLFNYPYNNLEKQMYIPYDKTYSCVRNSANLTHDETIKEMQKTINENNTSSQSNLCIGSYDALQTKELYNECNNIVFKSCKLEDFVNGLNNPEQCIMEVCNKNKLYVLYTYFNNFYRDEADTKIYLLNEKFGITKGNYEKKKYRENSSNSSKKQKDFDNILAGI